MQSPVYVPQLKSCHRSIIYRNGITFGKDKFHTTDNNMHCRRTVTWTHWNGTHSEVAEKSWMYNNSRIYSNSSKLTKLKCPVNILWIFYTELGYADVLSRYWKFSAGICNTDKSFWGCFFYHFTSKYKYFLFKWFCIEIYF
jgi:hypothetical protein